jgi:hypothetical protein
VVSELVALSESEAATGPAIGSAEELGPRSCGSMFSRLVSDIGPGRRGGDGGDGAAGPTEAGGVEVAGAAGPAEAGVEAGGAAGPAEVGAEDAREVAGPVEAGAGADGPAGAGVAAEVAELDKAEPCARR